MIYHDILAQRNQIFKEKLKDKTRQRHLILNDSNSALNLNCEFLYLLNNYNWFIFQKLLFIVLAQIFASSSELFAA